MLVFTAPPKTLSCQGERGVINGAIGGGSGATTFVSFTDGCICPSCSSEDVLLLGVIALLSGSAGRSLFLNGGVVVAMAIPSGVVGVFEFASDGSLSFDAGGSAMVVAVVPIPSGEGVSSPGSSFATVVPSVFWAGPSSLPMDTTGVSLGSMITSAMVVPSLDTPVSRLFPSS